MEHIAAREYLNSVVVHKYFKYLAHQDGYQSL
jgi:hypothetical protein